MQTFTLNNGVQIPVLGFGVFQIPPAKTAQAVAEAIKAGYRHIDTAQAYANEGEVGQGVKQSGVPRGELFITSKIWVENYGYEAAKASLERSLSRLDCGYIDLMLLHQALQRHLRRLARAGGISGGARIIRQHGPPAHPSARYQRLRAHLMLTLEITLKMRRTADNILKHCQAHQHPSGDFLG